MATGAEQSLQTRVTLAVWSEATRLRARPTTRRAYGNRRRTEFTNTSHISGLERSDKIEGEADHAPSPLQQAQNQGCAYVDAWRFGAKRQKNENWNHRPAAGGQDISV